MVTLVDTPNQNYSIQESSRMDICKRCGRKLKNPESIEIGFGKHMSKSLWRKSH